jgi:ribosome-associated protein
MIRINYQITIPESEITLDFVRSSGPGGQNVNKVSTQVQLRFDVVGSPSLPDLVRDRLMQLQRNKITSDGILIIKANRFRSQEQNRTDAVDKFITMVRAAAVTPKKRVSSKPTKASKVRRVDQKRHRAKIKQLRRKVNDFD